MASFPATVSEGSHTAVPAVVTVDRSGISLVAGDRALGTWPIDEVDVRIAPDEIVVAAAGDTVTLTLAEVVRFARAVERQRARTSRPAHVRAAIRGLAAVAAAAGLATLTVTAPWLTATLAIVSGGAAVLGGGLTLADASGRLLLPAGVTPVRLIAGGIALLAGGLWMDLSL